MPKMMISAPVVATRKVFGKMQIATAYLNVSRPTKMWI
jgi:hypothetical protein